MRRYRTLHADFDSRAATLEIEIQDDWEEQVKLQHRANRDATIRRLNQEYGEANGDEKVKNFIDLGSKPFSVVSYHNAFYHQIRNAYVVGAYYPALVGACGLGERILNHIVINLRKYYCDKNDNSDIATHRSFSNWRLMIETIAGWNVFEQDVEELFRKLSKLRNRSLHFNPDTYRNVKEQALNAIIILRDIINKQFGSIGAQRWYINDARGVWFVKKSFEEDPFVKEFIIPSCVYVGPFHSMLPYEDMRHFLDWPVEHYGEGHLTDEQFQTAFHNATDEQRVNVGAYMANLQKELPVALTNDEDVENVSPERA